MSLQIYGDADSGYRVKEQPIRLWMDAAIHENEITGIYEIEAVETDGMPRRLSTSEIERGKANVHSSLQRDPSIPFLVRHSRIFTRAA